MLLTFSRDVTLVRSDPNGHFIALLADGAGELHPVFESHRDRPFVIQNTQELCFLNVRQEDKEHLLAMFITSSDAKGSNFVCVECTEEGSLFRSLNVEIHGDGPKRAGSPMVTIGSKRSRLKCAVNVLVLSTESEIAIFGARIKQSDLHTLQLFLCCVIPVTAMQNFTLSNHYFFLQQGQEMRVYRVHDMVHASDRAQETHGSINLPHGRRSITIERVKTMDVFDETTGMILDSNGSLYLFQTTSIETLTLSIVPIKIPFRTSETTPCPITNKESASYRFLALTEQGAVYVMQLPVTVKDIEDEADAKGINCFATNEHIQGLCWMGDSAFLARTSNKLLLYTI